MCGTVCLFSADSSDGSSTSVLATLAALAEATAPNNATSKYTPISHSACKPAAISLIQGFSDLSDGFSSQVMYPFDL